MDWAEDLTAVGTLLLAGVATWQAVVTRQAVGATVNDVRESRQTRIDGTSPAVVFIPLPTLWPPRRASSDDVHTRPSFSGPTVPGDAEVAVALRFLARNEGAGTARIHLPMGVTDSYPDIDNYPGLISVAARQLSIALELLQREAVYMLPPQGTVVLTVEVVRTAAAWGAIGEQPETVAEVTVVGARSGGVLDQTQLQLIGPPVAGTALPKTWMWQPRVRATRGHAAPTNRSYLSQPTTSGRVAWGPFRTLRQKRRDARSLTVGLVSAVNNAQTPTRSDADAELVEE